MFIKNNKVKGLFQGLSVMLKTISKTTNMQYQRPTSNIKNKASKKLNKGNESRQQG